MLEDLNVSGMLKNHHLAQAIADVGFYEFRRQMAYKGKWYGCEIRLADRFYPSSKRCSGCGQIKPELGLGEREYRCGYCGLVMDRDLNAAINLERLLYIENERPTASSAGRIRFVKGQTGKKERKEDRVRIRQISPKISGSRCANHLPDPEQNGKGQKRLGFGLHAAGMSTEMALFIISQAILPQSPEHF